MNTDGWVIIGSKMDNTQLKKDLKQAENELKKYDNRAKSLAEQKTRAEVPLQGYYEKLATFRGENDAEINWQKTVTQEMTERLGLEEKVYQKLKMQQDEVYKNELARLDIVNKKIDENNMKRETAKLKVQQLTKEVEKLAEREKMQANIENINNSIKKVGNSISNVSKKVIRWGLAIFGIRSAYMAVRQAMSTLSQYDDQMAVNIEWIRYLLASTLKPLIEYIINLVYKLLSYVNYIAQAWFGVNLFANASAEAFKKQHSAMAGTAKSAKELQKTLTSFDEMNVLQDTSNANAGAGAGALPNFPKMEDVEVPEWLQWIVDHKNEILAILAGIATALGLIYFGIGLIKALGIGLIVGGIVYAIMSLLDYLKDPTWENFGKIIIGIGVAIVGLGILIGSVPVAIAGAVVLIIGLLIKYWDQIKAFIMGIVDWLREKANEVGDLPGRIIGAFADMIEAITNDFEMFIGGIKKIFDGLIEFIKGVFSGNKDQIIEGLSKILDGLIDMFVGSLKITWDAIIGLTRILVLTLADLIVQFVGGVLNILKMLWEGIKTIFSTVANWIYTYSIKPTIEFFKMLWNGIINGATLAFNGIKKAFSNIVNFFKDIINKIMSFFKNLGSNVGNVVASAFKAVINSVLRVIENILNSPIRAINDLIGVINKIPGINLTKLKTFNLPRLAKGGIVNLPSRGVPVGNAIAGERGAEGVIPLTDSQQMALLGEAIGKYITVNLTNINQMNGRVIGRELKELQNNDDFIYNK